MSPKVDLDRYFERIGYNGPRAVGLDTLAAIHLRHTVTIPFENLNPLLRLPVRLDLQSLEQKLVREKRGGYCFEHNLLFKHVLERLGFRVKGLAARVRWNVPEATVTARGHMVLLVDLDGRPHIADVGFGGLTLTGPLRLEVDVEQRTPHESFRITRSGDGFFMQASVDGTWRTLYWFDLQEQFLADYEVTNWYLSNHPASHFVTGLIAARPDLDRRHALRGNELATHHLAGGTDRRELATPRAIRDVLENTMRLALPDVTELDAALGRVIALGRAPASHR
jgi:N-hydroxyarylamine O-acetyltransferase